MKIISVVNNKGGVGKTVTSVNLAACLSKKGYRVLFVDLDKQGNGTTNFKVDKLKLNNTVGELFKKFDFPDYFNILTKNVIKRSGACNVDVIPANLKLEFVEYEIIGRPMREMILKRFLDEVKDNYDFCIIDCPPSLGIFVQNALVASNYFIIPTVTDAPSLEGIPAIVETFKNIKTFYNKELKILGVLITITNSRTKVYSKAKEQLIDAFGDIIFDSEIRRSIKIPQSHSDEMPLVEYDKNSEAAKEYIAFTDEVLERIKM